MPESLAAGSTEEMFANGRADLAAQTDMGWQNLSLMFDPAYFLSITHEDL